MLTYTVNTGVKSSSFEIRATGTVVGGNYGRAIWFMFTESDEKPLKGKKTYSERRSVNCHDIRIAIFTLSAGLSLAVLRSTRIQFVWPNRNARKFHAWSAVTHGSSYVRFAWYSWAVLKMFRIQIRNSLNVQSVRLSLIINSEVPTSGTFCTFGARFFFFYANISYVFSFEIQNVSRSLRIMFFTTTAAASAERVTNPAERLRVPHVFGFAFVFVFC